MTIKIVWQCAENSRKRLDQELKTCVEHRATLNLHQRGVGAVRFAPDTSKNTYLATASDDSHLIIWKYEPDRKGWLSVELFLARISPFFGMSSELWPTFYRAPQNSSLDDSEDSIECWTTHRIYKKHVEDVSDLSWAADSSKIASCGIDHSVFIWDVEQPGKEPIARLDLHTHYIQGIAFDPFGQIVVSLSADRTMRVYQAMKKSKKSKTKEWRQKYKVHAIQPAGYERQVCFSTSTLHRMLENRLNVIQGTTVVGWYSTRFCSKTQLVTRGFVFGRSCSWTEPAAVERDAKRRKHGSRCNQNRCKRKSGSVGD